MKPMCCALHSLEIQSAAQMKSCVVMVSCSCLMRGHCGGHCHDPRELLRAWRCIFEADPRRTENTVAGVCQMSGGGEETTRNLVGSLGSFTNLVFWQFFFFCLWKAHRKQKLLCSFCSETNCFWIHIFSASPKDVFSVQDQDYKCKWSQMAGLSECVKMSFPCCQP